VIVHVRLRQSYRFQGQESWTCSSYPRGDLRTGEHGILMHHIRLNFSPHLAIHPLLPLNFLYSVNINAQPTADSIDDCPQTTVPIQMLSSMNSHSPQDFLCPRYGTLLVQSTFIMHLLRRLLSRFFGSLDIFRTHLLPQSNIKNHICITHIAYSVSYYSPLV